MAFSMPRNVPTFDNPQRNLENAYWGSSGKTHNRNGIGHALGGLFKEDALPMYKDKPYSYAASKRQRPLLQRKRTWLFTALLICTILFYTILFPSTRLLPTDFLNSDGDLWRWTKNDAKSKLSIDWEVRRSKVKDAFILSWDGYARYAWGYDQYHPLTKTGTQLSPNGLGWTIVDSLDTLMLMNLTSRLSHAREWIATSLNYEQDHRVNTFEVTIRMLGGLLSAHYFSTTYPELANVPDDDIGRPGEDLYLDKAADLADRLLGAFETPSGIPYAYVNLKTLQGSAPREDGGASSTAEAGSMQLEFKYMAKLTGEKIYWEKPEKAIQVIDDNGAQDGLVPIFIHADRGTFRGQNIRLGSRGDSYYEYLLKQYIQTSSQEPIYQDMWDQAVAGVRKHLLTYSKKAHLTILGERADGLYKHLIPKMDHLVCFMPGAIALGATGGLPLAEAKRSALWGARQEDDMDLARELMKTCWAMYKATATGLAPEIAYFHVDLAYLSSIGGQRPSSVIVAAWDRSDNSSWWDDFIIKPQDSHNLQRPEAVESLFYLWRITGDDMYREWGWEMFKSFIQWTATDDGSFTSLRKANEIPPTRNDDMESYWLSETLKYFYLLFSPPTLLPLENIVINTQGHIFPRFDLKNGYFKTGWKRKERDSQGRLVEIPPHIKAAQQVEIEAKLRERKEQAKMPKLPVTVTATNTVVTYKTVEVVDATKGEGTDTLSI